MLNKGIILEYFRVQNLIPLGLFLAGKSYIRFFELNFEKKIFFEKIIQKNRECKTNLMVPVNFSSDYYFVKFKVYVGSHWVRSQSIFTRRSLTSLRDSVGLS